MNIKLNLSALKCVKQKMKGKDGEIDVLIIPIKANYLFEGEKGVYVDISAFAIKEPKTENKQTQTHILKQTLPSEIFKAMTDEQKKQTPIMGNVYEWAGSESSQPTAPANWNKDDDLPF